MNNEKVEHTMILIDSPDDFLHCVAIKRGYHLYPIYKKYNPVVRAISKRYVKYRLPNYEMWYGDWKNKIEKYDIVIVSAFENTVNVVLWIKKHFPDKRLIFWYWNPLFTCPKTQKITEEIAERWTFDMQDAQKYGMHFNPSYYFTEYQLPQKKIKYDLGFVGAEKGKSEELFQWKKILESMGLKSLFYVIGHSGSNMGFEEHAFLPYHEILAKLAECKVNFDITQDGQSGITVRCLESVFLKKKLITNNNNIEEFLFYNKKNIFILGKDDINDLKEFIQTPYEEIEERDYLYYDYDNWFMRFFEKA